MIVVGTAGHIDHGKSSIVRQLTGVDPDRLPEEKTRGLTIDLGFAFHGTAAGDTIAFVDVPGHERFVKNMIAGATGIDVVMLVIAADDGWMPQSQEHFQVVRLLGVNTGLIVINKIDLVEADWLELLEEDVRDKVRGTFLEEAPVFRVSAATGEGIESLRSYLEELPHSVPTRSDIGKARLYIDRSFIQPGIGGVVTGTLRGGTLRLGQSVSVWPALRSGKVRTLQSNNRDVELAVPGQRTAVSFTGIEKDVLERGGVISERSNLTYFRDHPVLALTAQILPESPVALANRRRILLMVGTTEMEGEVRLMAPEAIKPGSGGIVFFKPDRPVFALVGDRYIARLPTPMVTIGGGRVLDHLERFPRRRMLGDYEYLNQRSSCGVADLVVTELRKRVVTKTTDLLDEAEAAASAIQAALAELQDKGIAGDHHGFAYEKETFKAAVNAVQKAAESELKEKPHLKGLTLDALARLTGFGRETAQVLAEYLVAAGWMTRQRDVYNPAGRGMSLKGGIKDAYEQIMAAMAKNPYAPPTLASMSAGGKMHREAVRYLIETGRAHKCGSEFLVLAEVWEEIVAFIRERLNRTGTMAVAEMRDRFGFSRKFAIPILEETDRLLLTKREGDYRVKGDRFDHQDADS